MTNSDPRDQRTTDLPEQPVRTTHTNVGHDDRFDDGDGRTRDDQLAPAGYERARGDYERRTDGDIATRKVRETKPAFLTTEFWFAAGGIAALIVIYLIEDDPSLDLFRTALLATLIGIAYIVSRGLAKAGSRTTRQPEDPRLSVGHDLR
jgi:hypothetical protein